MPWRGIFSHTSNRAARGVTYGRNAGPHLALFSAAGELGNAPHKSARRFWEMQTLPQSPGRRQSPATRSPGDKVVEPLPESSH